MANISKFNGVALANIGKVDGVSAAQIAKIDGVTYTAAFTNTQSLSHGTSNSSGSDAVNASSTSSSFQVIQSNAWSISFWIKVGWGTSTGSSFHLIASDGGNVHNNMWRVFFNNGNNRLYMGWRSASNQRSNNFIYFHRGGTNEAAYISGLGTSWPSDKWSSSKRGYCTSDGFTLITLTKGTGVTASRTNLNMYWNSKNLGTLFYTNGNNSGTPSMDANQARDFAIGNNSWNGNGTNGSNGVASLYDEVSFWNKELSQSEVAEIWNGTDAVGATDGSPINLQTSSMAANLIGYWRFETNGTVSTVGNATLTLNGNSTTSTTVP